MGQPGGSHGRKPRDPTQPYRQQNAYHRDGRQHQLPAAKEWCIPRVSAEFVAHMEDVLALYAEPYDPQWPVGCFDETSTQLPAETRPPLPPQPGRPRRQDYEYRREGTRNLFLACEPLAGWRQVAVIQRRTMQDFARQMRWLVDEAYPEVPVGGWSWTTPACVGVGSEHPSPSVAVRDVPGGGSADCETAGVSLHAQAFSHPA